MKRVLAAGGILLQPILLSAQQGRYYSRAQSAVKCQVPRAEMKC